MEDSLIMEESVNSGSKLGNSNEHSTDVVKCNINQFPAHSENMPYFIIWLNSSFVSTDT